ncbi:helix-turn-helix domain-containing protein [Halalkalibacter sp. MEB205]|uniref:Helix-turn-helix domain-containing protein n=1 Tax=Halalkalibacter alkaliphilus TaxID=2917993 RepID=A0A9X2CQ91_9BACI|nr:helix-turn-helix domain-containing protein [Halalkalibacter alkaliphilus]
MLSENDCSLQELSEILNMGKTTIHHHLKILRAAILVEMNGTKYSLNANVIKLLFKELDHYLKQ